MKARQLHVPPESGRVQPFVRPGDEIQELTEIIQREGKCQQGGRDLFLGVALQEIQLLEKTAAQLRGCGRLADDLSDARDSPTVPGQAG